MAIPFNLPSDEETENNYRSMDDLLLQLYRVLRQILVHRAPAENQPNIQENIHGRVPAPHPHEVESGLPLPDVVPRLPLPDVVSCGPAPQAVVPRPPPRRGRRRRVQRRHDRTPGDVPEKEAAAEAAAETPGRKAVTVRDNWTQVGEDLRQIADELTTSLQDIDQKRVETTPNNQKSMSFLSLLVPPPFRGSIWMAVVFLFGWGALHRLR